MLLLNQVTDDLVVKIRNWFPLEIRGERRHWGMFFPFQRCELSLGQIKLQKGYRMRSLAILHLSQEQCKNELYRFGNDLLGRQNARYFEAE